MRDRAAVAAFEAVVMTVDGWPATMSINCFGSMNWPAGLSGRVSGAPNDQDHMITRAQTRGRGDMSAPCPRRARRRGRQANGAVATAAMECAP